MQSAIQNGYSGFLAFRFQVLHPYQDGNILSDIAIIPVLLNLH